MSGINKVILIGNLGSDPELRDTSGGTQVCNFRLATNEQYKDKDGNKQTRAEWHSIVTFGKLAAICGQYLRKGKQIYIEGRVQTREWQDKNDQKRWTTEIVANQMLMLGGKQDSAGYEPAAQNVGTVVNNADNMAADGGGADDEDLPF